MVNQLRKAFPKKVTSETVKKLGLASNNESYVINALQFIGLIDQEGNQTEVARKVFAHHKDEEFAKSFSELVEVSYAGLFELYGTESWHLGNDDLITFFRKSDQTSEAIGRRQAATFKIFAALSGQAELPAVKTSKSKSFSGAPTKKAKDSHLRVEPENQNSQNREKMPVAGRREFGLAVRVEINLPPDGSKETYDNIFKSIKENLLNV